MEARTSALEQLAGAERIVSDFSHVATCRFDKYTDIGCSDVIECAYRIYFMLLQILGDNFVCYLKLRMSKAVRL